MAVRKQSRPKRVRFRAKVARTASEPNPLSPFREGKGKPSLREEYLLSEREKLFYMFQWHWHELEWSLACARTVEGVRKAFSIEEFKLNPGPLAPLLRESLKRATRKQLEKTRKELGDAHTQSRNAQEKLQSQLQKSNDAERVALSVTEEAEKSTREDLEGRTANLTTIQAAIDDIQNMIREYEIRHKTRVIPGVPSADVIAWSEILRTLERDKQADASVCVQLDARIRAITPEVRKIGVQNLARHKALLMAAEGEQKGAYQREKSFQDRYLNEEAFVYRNEILKFLKTKEYRLTPFVLANAIAGLPHITARRSAQRCSGLKTKVPQSTRYEMFQFIKQVWEICRKKLGPLAVQMFEREIRKLPKFRIVDGHRRPNSLRIELRQDWHYLRSTLESPTLATLHPKAVPEAIVTTFLRKWSYPESAVTPTIAEAEMITD